MANTMPDFGGSTDTENTDADAVEDDGEPSPRMQAYEGIKAYRTLLNKFVAKCEKADEQGACEGARELSDRLKGFVFGDFGDSVRGGMSASDHRDKHGDGDRITKAPDLETRAITDDERASLNADVNGNADERVGDEDWILPVGASIAVNPEDVDGEFERITEWADEPHYADEGADEDDEPAVENPHEHECGAETASGGTCGRAVESAGETCWQHDEPAEDADEDTSADEGAGEGASIEDIEPEVLAQMSPEQINALK